MDNRTRIRRTILGEPVDRPPFFFFFPPWPETIRRWRREGLPVDVPWDAGFGFDAGFTRVPVNIGFYPPFTAEVLEEKGDTYIYRDELGVIKEGRKDDASVPIYRQHPVTDPRDWERLKSERLNPDDQGRFPADLAAVSAALNGGPAAVLVGDFPYGLFGTCRELLGVENFLVSFHTQPGLIADMMDYLTSFWLRLYARILMHFRLDAIHIWEDMSGKTGSLISPAMIRRFMLPNYRRITAFAREHDIPVVSVDTDGDCRELIPLFIEGGINLVFPFEVAAGCDILAYRRLYPGLGIMGGIDKRAVARGPEAIDRELERISPMFVHGRYIAALDHLVPPDISWDHFCYFVHRLREIIFA
ncbi:MAG: uroporphyrinogen decarboxylase family protein [Patescibacteria group bacterium]